MTRRERELLEKLEEIRRAGERLTIADFLKRTGYRDKTGIRRFPVLRKALHDYCVVRSGRGWLNAPAAGRELERQVEEQDREVARLRRIAGEVDELRARVAALMGQRDTLAQETGMLRALVSALAAQITGRNIKRAQEVEAELLRVVQTIISDAPADTDAQPIHDVQAERGATKPGRAMLVVRGAP